MKWVFCECISWVLPQNSDFLGIRAIDANALGEKQAYDGSTINCKNSVSTIAVKVVSNESERGWLLLSHCVSLRAISALTLDYILQVGQIYHLVEK